MRMILWMTAMDWRLMIDRLTGLFYPRICAVCGQPLVRGEGSVCIACLAAMPKVESVDGGRCPEVERLLLGSRMVERAASMFHYHRASPYAEIIKDAKYHSSPQAVADLAGIFARRLLTQGFFDGVDIIVPVPLHKAKRARRGYNQSSFIAKGVEKATGIPVVEALEAVRPHATQTHRSTTDRQANVEGVFEVCSSVADKTVLLVDDVLTTGATAIACCDTLRRGGASSVCVLTLGFAGSVG